MCELTSPVREATDSGLKLLLRLMVNCSCLGVVCCCLLTTKYKVCVPLGWCCPLGTTWVC